MVDTSHCLKFLGSDDVKDEFEMLLSMFCFLYQVLISSAKQDVLLGLLIALSLFGWGVKQAINVIQVNSRC